MATKQNDDLVLNVREMAKVMKISIPLAYELTKQEGFPVLHIGRKRRLVPFEELKLWLKNNCENNRYYRK